MTSFSSILKLKTKYWIWLGVPIGLAVNATDSGVNRKKLLPVACDSIHPPTQWALWNNFDIYFAIPTEKEIDLEDEIKLTME